MWIGATFEELSGRDGGLLLNFGGTGKGEWNRRMEGGGGEPEGPSHFPAPAIF